MSVVSVAEIKTRDSEPRQYRVVTDSLEDAPRDIMNDFRIPRLYDESSRGMVGEIRIRREAVDGWWRVDVMTQCTPMRSLMFAVRPVKLPLL